MSAGITTFAFTRHLDSQKLVLHSRSVMVALSHLIEEQAHGSGPGAVLIATFQRLSLYLQELPRYQRFAPQLAATYVVGVPDVTPPPLEGVKIIELDASWPLVQEWVVIASGPACCAALFARDAEGYRPDQRSRRYKGRWTTSPEIVDKAIADFHAACELPLPQFSPDKHARRQQAALLQREIPLRLRKLKRS